MGRELLNKLKQKVVRETFSQKPVDPELLLDLLDITNHSPSRFNLQPWHFIIVSNQALRKIMFHIGQEQKALIDAPITIVFVADPDAWKKPFKEVMKLSVKLGALDKSRAKMYHSHIKSFFDTSPLGLKGLFKKISMPIRKISSPTPRTISSDLELKEYVNSQSMLAAGTFMVAAKASGLSATTIQAFDEQRLKKLLNIPKRMTVPIVIPIGYPLELDDRDAKEIRLPLEEKTSINLFGNSLKLNLIEKKRD